MLTVSARTCQGLCASSADQTYWKEGKAAPVMLRLHRKYGNLSNREISKVVGLVEQYAVTPTVFANAAAEKGLVLFVAQLLLRWMNCHLFCGLF